VPVSRSKSVDQLYQEIEPYDLVIVSNSPLADTLNRRLERPHFGPFAITPRRLATRRRETAEDRTAFLELIDKTDLGWKQISYIVGDVLQCWEYQGTAESILEYDGFDTPATRTVVETIKPLQTSSRLLTDYTIDAEAYDSVAVVGESQLTNLERSILPDEYASIDRFDDQSFELPPFRIFESPAAMVDAILETVTPETADNVGIVLDASSHFSSLVESALETNGIPYYGGPGFMDDRDHRAFLQLLRCLTAGSNTRVQSVKPLLSCLGLDLSVEHDNECLVDVSDSRLEWLHNLTDRVGTLTVGETLDAYETQTGNTLDLLREELTTLSLLEQPITEAVINQLTFYLETYEVPVDRENSGVLLADSKSSTFVDRPVVFYLGLDEDWTHNSPNRPWVDREEEFDRNVDGFQSLLQSGVDQYYFVQDVVSGTPVTPCLYFEELLETDYERFSDLESIHHERTARTTGDGFQYEPPKKDVEPDLLEAISQSSLNTYANSPRDYFFGRIVDHPNTHYFAEGNLFHDFAEFVVNHPDFVDEDRTEEIVEIMIEETRSFHRDVDLATRRTRYKIGLQNIQSYLTEHAPTETPFLTPANGWGENFFADYFDRAVDSPATERWFKDETLKIKGLIDLVQSPRQLVDFKSGNKKSSTQVTKHSSIEEPSDKPNFQALCYLTYWRQQQPDTQLSFTFFHFLETLDDDVTGEGSVADCLTTVTYHPIAFDEFVQSRQVFEELQEEASNDCNKTFSKSSYETYLAAFDEHPIPRTRDADEMAASAFGEALIDRMVADVGDYKYVQNGCLQAFKHLCGYRTDGYFKGDLDEFEQFVDEQIEQVNRYRSGEGRFPVEGRAGEPNYRYINNRDLLLTEDRSIQDTTGTDAASIAAEESMEESQ